MQSYDVLGRILLGISIAGLFVTAFFISPRETLSQASTPLTGFAWSDTIGWISLNCSDLGTCGTSNYGVTIAANGTMSGYAWNDNVGWISANSADLTGCPTAPCTARMNEFAMQGWMKALSASDAQSGAWDGFISLNGASYGPTLSAATGNISGYGWGDMNIGWVSFNSGFNTVTTPWRPQCASQYSCINSTTRQNACAGSVPETCSAGLACIGGACTTPPAPSTSPGNALTVNPRLVRTGNTALVTWSVADATSCTVTENSSGITDSWSGTNSTSANCATHSGAACRTSAITTTTTYTLSCTGLGGNLTQTATVYTRPQFKEI